MVSLMSTNFCARKACALMQSRATTFQAALEWKCFFVDAPDYDEKAVNKLLRAPGAKAALESLLPRLAATDFSAPAIEEAVRATEAQHGIQPGKLNQPIRVAVTGTTIGAGLCETLELIGRARAMARLDHALANLC